MDARKIVVIVEDVEVARRALQWILHNFVRFGDLITLLHVFPSTGSRNRSKLRRQRLKGFQLALSFKDICNSFPNTQTEIVVTEGDVRDQGGRIVSMVREIGASTLVIGLHNKSFIYKLGMNHISIGNNLKCKVLAIKDPTSMVARTVSLPDSSTNMDFSQIEISALSMPEIQHQKIPYQICPDPAAIIWRSGTTRDSRGSMT